MIAPKLMKIAIASDHAGWGLKEAAGRLARELGHEVEDLGTRDEQPVDYPDYAERVARRVAAGEADQGILVCGTGNGMCMTANKVPGVRAALAHDAYTAGMARAHNDANILCLGARATSPATAEAAIRAWFATSFEGGRHAGRVKKIRDLETRR